MSSQDTAPDPALPHANSPPDPSGQLNAKLVTPLFAVGSKYTTPYGGVVFLNEDEVVEFENAHGDHIGLMSRPSEIRSRPFDIYVSSIERTHPSTFSHYTSGDGETHVFHEDKTAETFQEMVRIGAVMLGYDHNVHTCEVTFEDDGSPLTEIVLFRYAAETMLGKSKERGGAPTSSETPDFLYTPRV